MKRQSFSLMPFPKGGLWPFKLGGTCFRQENILGLNFNLQGKIRDLAIPPTAVKASRRIGLWENTCFEFFVAPWDSHSYWEFNLSPSGDWNVFTFETYRGILVEEGAFLSFPFSVTEGPDTFRLDLEFSLDRIIPVGKPLKMAISSVLKNSFGEVSMWAMTHPGPEPDFHHPEGFIIEL